MSRIYTGRGCAGCLEARLTGEVTVASGDGAVRSAREGSFLPVTDRSHRHRKRGWAADGAYTRSTSRIRAGFDRRADTGRIESRQKTRYEAWAQAVAFRRSAETCP